MTRLHSATSGIRVQTLPPPPTLPLLRTSSTIQCPAGLTLTPSTITNILTTNTITQSQPGRVHVTSSVTATSTSWVTERQAKLKRAPAPTPGPIWLGKRMVQADSVDAIINAVMANETTISSTPATGVTAEMYAAISSACSCHGQLWPALYTNTVTETEETSVSMPPLIV